MEETVLVACSDCAVAVSRSRVDPRARSKLATLTHATNTTKLTAASNSHKFLTKSGPRKLLCSGSTLTVRPVFEDGNCCARRDAMAFISCCAVSYDRRSSNGFTAGAHYTWSAFIERQWVCRLSCCDRASGRQEQSPTRIDFRFTRFMARNLTLEAVGYLRKSSGIALSDLSGHRLCGCHRFLWIGVKSFERLG